MSAVVDMEKAAAGLAAWEADVRDREERVESAELTQAERRIRAYEDGRRDEYEALQPRMAALLVQVHGLQDALDDARNDHRWMDRFLPAALIGAVAMLVALVALYVAVGA